jgi:hypothetical protein
MFDNEQRAEIRHLCHQELALIHRLNQAQGSYRFLCMVNGQPIFSHTPVGTVIRDLEQEPDL